jgi:hypothetical protein
MVFLLVAAVARATVLWSGDDFWSLVFFQPVSLETAVDISDVERCT